MKPLLALSLILFLLSCGTVRQASYSDKFINWQDNKSTSGKDITHTLFLVGDTGELDDTLRKTNLVLSAVNKHLLETHNETSLVFLGDNVYPYGLPDMKAPNRSASEDILDAQLHLAKSTNGKTYFIPGNHDWNKHKPDGRKAIKRQEDYVEKYADDNNLPIHFFPKNACGDPKVVKVNKDLIYVFIDTQWWLQDWTHEKNINKGCDIKSRNDFLKSIQEIFTEYKNDQIIVMMHHPIRSEGKHGGKYSFKHHLFPLTELNERLWIPLPIIGSLYPLYRQLTGSTQDVTNAYNQELVDGIDQIAKKLRVNVVFAAGHEHGLQYFDTDRIKYIVSGGGSRTDYVASGGKADYAREARGFAKIDFYENFEAWIEYYTITGEREGEEAILEFRAQLRAARPGTIAEEKVYPPVTEKTRSIAANEKFAAGPIKKMFLGSQYRDMWATPVTAEVIDLETKFGGLTPIKKGGGMASNSLRMQKDDGKQYILRSIKKDYTKLVPSSFGNLKILDVLADQNSASHPYNALVIPALSKAANIYYTDPKLVYLKHQQGLGNYNSQFSEELYLLEERPDGNWEDAEQFGHCSEIIGYTELLDVLTAKKNHFIDQQWVLKSRIFDLFIHDWDRHDDQWRWAKFKEGEKNVYRPIPRDRDQAFYRFKGLIPWYIATFIQKNFKTIKGDCKDVKHQSFNAKHFDRYFLHELEWTDWERIITQMQKDISDTIIESAMTKFPKEVLSLDDDEELIAILKERKHNLLKIGRRLYDYLSQEVEITGTENEDQFYISISQNGEVEVRHTIESAKHGTLTKYQRTFSPTETKELRIYGLRGDDTFLITGASNSKIKIRFIGGEGDDKANNQSECKHIYGYDEPQGMQLTGQIIDKKSTALNVNEYDRRGFIYNNNFPFFTFGNTLDDGWWLGGSFSWTNQAWRRKPYLSKQQVSLSVAPGSQNAVQASYEGHFPDRISKLDFVPAVQIRSPYYENYFGLGNTTTYNSSLATEYHWVRMQFIDVEPLLRYKLGKNAAVDFGPIFQYRNISISEGRVTESEQAFFDEETLAARSYYGASATLDFSYIDNSVFPSNGLSLSAKATYLQRSTASSITQLSINASFYFKLINRPRTVFATQIGYKHAYGDREFYHYPAIGNNSGLRGYRNERFRGDNASYHNLDLRTKLIDWDNAWLPMDIGIILGYDYGRVSLKEIIAPEWHTSQTVGIFFEVLGAIIVQPYYSINEEEHQVSLRVGFSF